MPAMQRRRLFVETIKAGTVAAFAMPIAGTLTKPFLGWHVHQYGRKVAELFMVDPTPPVFFAQHVVWSWIAALLLILLLNRLDPRVPILVGAGVGLGYGTAVNLLALPLVFGDPLPWQASMSDLIQPLVVCTAFGACVAWVAQSFIRSNRRAP